MPFHILWSINLYETRQKRGWPVVVKQRKKEGTSTMERVLAPLRNGTHILLLQRRNANLMSFWKYNKGSSSKTFASHKVSRFLYNECWNYISFFRQQLSFWPWLSTCIVGCLGEILPRLLLWMLLEYDYYRTADFQVSAIQECILPCFLHYVRINE